MAFNHEEIPTGDGAPKPGSTWVSFLLEIIQTVILAVALYFLIDAVIARVRVENISMQPTLQENELVLVNKLAYRLGDFQRGDIVVFHHTADQDYIKRVIGLPGDDVRIANGQVFVNGYELTEPYIAQPPSYNGEWKVPGDSIFVLGDNRNQSSDSHSWGFVPRQYVVGKALVIYWPLQQLKVLNQPLIVNAASQP